MIFGSNLFFNLYIEEIQPTIGSTNGPTKLIKGNINDIYKLYQF